MIIACDLDATLAHYKSGDYERLNGGIGEPIEKMVNNVKYAIETGHEVVIFTARVSRSHHVETVCSQIDLIKEWCLKHIGKELHVTADKDPSFDVFWDDKAIGVEVNSGVFDYEKDPNDKYGY